MGGVMSPDMSAQDREREMMMELQEAAARKQVAMKESMERWKAEREANADYIAQLKKNKEDRRKEIEAQEALLQQMRDEEEAEEAAALEEEKKLEGDGEVPAEAKKVDAVPADSGKQNFADQKKFKSKDEQEYQEALTALIKPFDVSKLSEDDLKKKISELYDIFTNLINDKINLNKKLIDQDAILKTLREKLNELLDAKAAKKGVIDMHKFYPGKKSHPPKMQIFSKYDNRKGTRSYDERKEMYDVGTDVVRPKMLASMWDEKFSAWLTENPENE